MKLTKSDIEKLLKWGHLESDINQLEQAANICVYTDKNEKRISCKKAIDMLGREVWLSGISRAAFHWDCGRGEGDNYVGFDCSKIFK